MARAVCRMSSGSNKPADDGRYVEVHFQDKAGGFIKSDEALVAYQPLLPGQTSPFKVGTINNPLIRHYTIGFKQMFGGELKAAR